MKADVPAAAPGRIFTFYSYKGGTGRTMLLANVAWILASQGRRVLAVDWDLEAPGLHRYFHPFLLDPELTDTDGIIDMVLEYATESVSAGPTEDPEWYRRHADVLRFACSLDYEFAGGGTLDLLTAGRQGHSYSTRVNTFDWRSFYDRQGGGAFLEAIRQRMRATYDYILIDSRTGVSDTSGICTVQMPDLLVVCFTLNNQSIEGASGIATSIAEQRPDPAFRIYPVPTRVELAEKDKLEQRRALCRSRFALFPTAVPHGGEREEYWGAVEMPYVPYYAYEEILTTIGDRPGQQTSLLAAAERLTAYLTDGAVTRAAPLAEQERQQLLARYAPRPKQIAEDELSREAEKVFGRLDAAQQQAARRLFTRLVRPGRPNEGDDVAISAPVAEVGAMLQSANAFVTAGILVVETEDATAQPLVRFGSPALPARWSRLRDWLQEDRTFLAWRELLRTNGAEWAATRDNSVLLTGASLAAALEWESKRADDLSPADRTFIAASARARRRSKVLGRAIAVVVAAVLIGGVLLYQTSGSAALRTEQALDLTQRAGVLLVNGNVDSARVVFQQAIQLDERLPEAHIGLAQIRLSEGDAAAALTDLDRAVALDSGRADAWAYRGTAHALLNRGQESIEDYTRALHLDSSRTDVLFNRGVAYQAAGRDSAAIADFRAVVDAGGDAPTRQAANARLEQLGVRPDPTPAPRRSMVVLRYQGEGDGKAVEEVVRALAAAGYAVRPGGRTSDGTRGYVRAYTSQDLDAADDVAAIVERTLAGMGYPLRLERFPIRNPGPPQGEIEVWLPALSTAALQGPSRR